MAEVYKDNGKRHYREVIQIVLQNDNWWQKAFSYFSATVVVAMPRFPGREEKEFRVACRSPSQKVMLHLGVDVYKFYFPSSLLAPFLDPFDISDSILFFMVYIFLSCTVYFLVSVWEFFQIMIQDTLITPANKSRESRN